MTAEETRLLNEWQQLFINIPWPSELKESYDIADYSEQFRKALKNQYRELKEKTEPLNFYETALVIFYNRVTKKFKPEIVSKKTKVKTPKVGTIAEIICESCCNEAGIWTEKAVFPLVTEIHLVCTKCSFILSDPVTIATKQKTTRTRVVKEEKEGVENKPKGSKKPVKAELEIYEGMLLMINSFGQSFDSFSQEHKDIYDKVKKYKEGS